MSKNNPPRDENDDVIVSEKNPRRYQTKVSALIASCAFTCNTTIVMFGAGFYIKRDVDGLLLCRDGVWRSSDPCPAA